jgi:hypothetical protein
VNSSQGSGSTVFFFEQRLEQRFCGKQQQTLQQTTRQQHQTPFCLYDSVYKLISTRTEASFYHLFL